MFTCLASLLASCKPALRSTTLLTNTHTAVYSHSCSLLVVTASYNRPKLLPCPKHHQSGSHCIFVPGHHMTRSLLQYSKHRQYLDRCVDFLEGLTSHFDFCLADISSQVLTQCDSTRNVSSYSWCLFVSRSEHCELPRMFAPFLFQNVPFSEWGLG